MEVIQNPSNAAGAPNIHPYPGILQLYKNPRTGPNLVYSINVSPSLINRNIHQDYDFFQQIGSGSHGIVHLCRNKISRLKFACKTIRKRKFRESIVYREKESKVYGEIELMYLLRGHPGVVNLEAVYQDSECYHLVMEWVSGGEFLHHIKSNFPCSEAQTAKWIRDIMITVKYCHDMGIVHRDIKPENLLVTESGRLKLIDFGYATRLTKGQRLSELVGTNWYHSPEIVEGNYTEKTDIWSVGIILYVLFMREIPFRKDNYKDVYKAIKAANLGFDGVRWVYVSPFGRDLISKMLTIDVSARLSADQVLKHPWFDMFCKI